METRKRLGEPDIIQVRKQFTTDAAAKIWEDRVLSSIPKNKRQFWLNQTFSSFRGVVFTEVIRKRIGESSKGRICAPETRNKISKTLTVRDCYWSKGIPRSEEVKEKISKSLKDRYLKYPKVPL
jgi:hypothetical protein